MPNIPGITDETHMGRVETTDPQTITQCEEAVMMWQQHMDQTIAASLAKVC